MNNRILIAVVVMTMFVCQQVHAQAEDVPETEVTELEGTWEVVSEVISGEQSERNRCFFRFEGNKMYYKEADDYNWREISTISVNPSAMPAEIEYEITTPSLTIRDVGIYEIYGDLLRICYANSGEHERLNRPDRFESTEDYRTQLWVLRRVEEDGE